MNETQANHWGMAFGTTSIPVELSKNHSVLVIHKNDQECADDPETQELKWLRISDSAKNKLIADIKELINQGITGSGDIYDELHKRELIPVVGGKKPAARNCIYRFAWIVRKDLKEKNKPPLHERIAKLYQSGVTDRATIRKTLKCSKEAVYRSLLRHELIKRTRKIKK